MNAYWFLFPLILIFMFGPWRHRARRNRWNWNQDDRADHMDPEPRDSGRAGRAEREARDRQREEQIEMLETRVAELESRLDYAERLMTQRPDSQALPLKSEYGQ